MDVIPLPFPICGKCQLSMVPPILTFVKLRELFYRYHYYTCYRKQRYGASACPSERIDADQLDLAIQRALLETLDNRRLIEAAVADFIARTRAALPRRQTELSR